MSNILYKDFAKHASRAEPRYYLDVSRHPLMEHILHLQKYRREIKELIRHSENAKDDKGEDANLISLSSIPRLLELTEFLNYKDQNAQNSDIELSEEAIKCVLSKVVTRILLVTGYSVVSSNLLQMLSCLVYNYLKALVFSMVRCHSLNEPVTVESLEKALIQDGMTDIEGLYHYKEERIIKFQACLYSECKRLQGILESNAKKLNSTSSKSLKRKKDDEFLDKDIVYEQRTGVEVHHVNESLTVSEHLVEDIYLRKKLKRKCETQIGLE